MTRFDYDWVDAFSDRPFGGNGCAVVHSGAGLDDETCLKFVRETSLVECTFTGPSNVADIHVRYFLASREIPFAGHPTLATAVALRDRGIIADGDVTFETQAGIIAITVNGAHATMTQVAPRFGNHVPAKIVAPVFGLEPSDIIAPPQIVATGLAFCITLLRDHATLARAQMDPDGLAAYFSHIDAQGTDMMEPFLVVQGGATPAGDTFARLLMAPPSPSEDPFTGSATGAMASYLWANQLITSPRFVAEQGHSMDRPGRADVEVLGDASAISGVRVGGYGHVLMSGTLRL